WPAALPAPGAAAPPVAAPRTAVAAAAAAPTAATAGVGRAEVAELLLGFAFERVLEGGEFARGLAGCRRPTAGRLARRRGHRRRHGLTALSAAAAIAVA